MMLKLENLTLGYDGHIIVNDLSLDIPPNKITTFIGANGCGKSTILNSISRFLKPVNGRVLLEGKDIRNMKSTDVAKHIAVLPQMRKVPGDINVHTLVAYGRYPYLRFGRRLGVEDYKVIDWAMDKTGVKGLQHRRVSTLSGGEQQRAWIAMTVAQQTEILILDEPTTYLDIAYQIEVLELVRELNEKLNLTIIMVLHDINLAARYSHKIVALKNGEIHKFANTEEAITKGLLGKVFNIDARLYKDEVNDCVYFIPQRVKK